MLGLFLAKRGVDVLVLEGHEDFEREFRGEILQPSTSHLLDELGLLEYVLAQPHSLLEVGKIRLNGRSNKSFVDWGEVFNDQILATAILDRLLHHATTVNIKGESYRLREKKKAGLLGRRRPADGASEPEEVEAEA